MPVPAGLYAQNQIAIGTFGWNVGRIACAAFEMTRTDVGGFYIRGPEWTKDTNGVPQWRPCIIDDPTRFPAALFAQHRYPSGIGSMGFGCWDFTCTADGSVIYAMYLGSPIKSIDQGYSWTICAGWAGVTGTQVFDSNGPHRGFANKMCGDPANGNILFIVGTLGLFFTLDGGATFTRDTAVPAPGAYGIVKVDPTSAATGGRRQRIFYAPDNAQMWVTSNAQGLWTQTAGGPVGVTDLEIDGSGRVYAPNGTSALPYWTGSAWASMATASDLEFYANYCTVKPGSDNDLILVGNTTTFMRTANRGASWFGKYGPSDQICAASPIRPLIAAVMNANFNASLNAVCNKLVWDTNRNKIAVTGGWGPFWMKTAPWSQGGSGDLLTWNYEGDGIEELCAHATRYYRDGNAAQGKRCTKVLMHHDRGATFVKASGEMIMPLLPGLTDAHSFDCADNDGANYGITLIGRFNNQSVVARGGVGTETTWLTRPTAIDAGGSVSDVVASGSVAVGRVGNIVWAPTMNFNMRVSRNDTADWFVPSFQDVDGTPLTLPNESAAGGRNGTGWGFSIAIYHVTQRVCSDRDNPGHFYAFNDGAGALPRGVYRSVDEGQVFRRRNTGSLPGGALGFYHSQMLMENGILFLIYGDIGGEWKTNDANTPLMYSSDGGQTWATVANVNCPRSITIGAPRRGETVPRIEFEGYKNNVEGIYSAPIDALGSFTTVPYRRRFDSIHTLGLDPILPECRDIGGSGTGWDQTSFAQTFVAA